MANRIILIPKDDIIKYPPTLSLINVLLKLGKDVECVGRYSDETGRKQLESQGVKFVDIFREIKDSSRYRIVNWLTIIKRMKQYEKAMKHYFYSANISDDDIVWIIYSNSIAHLQPYIEKYNYVLQFYEFENFAIDGKSRLLYPSYDVYRFLDNAKALVHCEYNRAVITNGLYGIDKHFYILPNKPYELERDGEPQLPDDISNVIVDVKKKTDGKRVVLYQGIFDSSERRLEEFCEAMELLPENYVFIAMGGRGGYFEEIKKKYESDRVIFIPFIRPPHHLQITKLASIGVLTYHPAAKNYVDVINPLYCAPNKIFEFGKFGIPMIANDVPGLRMIFNEYHCGETISCPQTPEKIAETILKMDAQYEEMSNSAHAYYESVDVKAIVKDVLEKASE